MENNLSVDEKVSNFKNDASYLEFAYDEFKQFYELVKEENILKDSLAFVSFLEDFVILTFFEKPNCKIRIFEKNKFFKREDFQFLPRIESYGALNQYTFLDFILKELKINKIKLFAVFISFLFFILLTYDTLLIRNINEMILTSITLFITIFILFFSKGDKANHKKMMKNGYTYRLIQNDKYILNLSVLLVPLSIFTVGLTFTTYGTIFNQLHLISFSLDKFIENLELQKESLRFFKMLLISIVTSLNVTLLAECYFSIIQYYFEKEKTFSLVNNSAELLDEEIERYNLITEK